MLVWNIGAEGQLYMGAFASCLVAYTLPDAPAWALLPAMVVAGFAGGALWGAIPGALKAFLGVNEIITSLMLNYIAIQWVNYLVIGPWQDPSSLGFPSTPRLSPSATLPMITQAWYLPTLAYEIRVIGENARAARYAGMSLKRNIILVMLVSGGLAGLAGMSEISGNLHLIKRMFSPGYGYTAIIVAWLAKLNPWGVILVSLLLGGLYRGSDAIPGAPKALGMMLQAVIFFVLIGGEVLVRYRVRWGRGA